jgi:hypothetical protein
MSTQDARPGLQRLGKFQKEVIVPPFSTTYSTSSPAFPLGRTPREQTSDHYELLRLETILRKTQGELDKSRLRKSGGGALTHQLNMPTTNEGSLPPATYAIPQHRDRTAPPPPLRMPPTRAEGRASAQCKCAPQSSIDELDLSDLDTVAAESAGSLKPAPKTLEVGAEPVRSGRVDLRATTSQVF